jgi:hypothetical protein
MNELNRDARELLSSLGDADGPSGAQVARMKRKLGLALGAAGGVVAVAGATGAAKAAAGAAAAAAAGAGAKAGGTGLGGLLSVFALGAAAGVGVSTSSAVVRNFFEAPAPAHVIAAAPVSAPPVRARSDAPVAPGAPAVAPEAPPELALSAPSAAPAAASPAPGPVSSSVPTEATLGPEVELVIAAKRELTLGRPYQALALVERLATEFPNGALREERILLKVLGLCAVGQVDHARRLAREFAATSPRSPLLPRLERSCGAAERAGY